MANHNHPSNYAAEASTNAAGLSMIHKYLSACWKLLQLGKEPDARSRPAAEYVVAIVDFARLHHETQGGGRVYFKCLSEAFGEDDAPQTLGDEFYNFVTTCGAELYTTHSAAFTQAGIMGLTPQTKS